MSLEELLEQVEEKYYGEWEEKRAPVVEVLIPIQTEALSEGTEEFHKFSDKVMDTCGGIYTPYLMWVELSNFIDDPENRDRIHIIIQAFVDSGFELEESKKMKSLLITYFAQEKEFEVNKVKALIVEKSHPDVQEYFRKIQNFVAKNKTSVDMYINKFNMIRKFTPDFDLIRMPVIKLKEHLAAL